MVGKVSMEPWYFSPPQENELCTEPCFVEKLQVGKVSEICIRLQGSFLRPWENVLYQSSTLSCEICIYPRRIYARFTFSITRRLMVQHYYTLARNDKVWRHLVLAVIRRSGAHCHLPSSGCSVSTTDAHVFKKEIKPGLTLNHLFGSRPAVLSG
jgi:hypothetical protein